MRATVVISKGTTERERGIENALAKLCVAGGLNVLAVPHLYHLSEQSETWRRLAGIDERLVVATWLYPRPAEWVLRSRGVGAGDLTVLDLKDFKTAEEAFASIRDALGRDDREATPTQAAFEEIADPVKERWYPVMDAGRCENCGNCLQFCLFGVYALNDAGRVRVTHPDSCKPGCPACSRICPEGAIMFPLYGSDAAIAGAPGMVVSPDAASRQMFYKRTRKTCPVCGATPDAPGRGEKEGTCPECGRAMRQQDRVAPEIEDKKAASYIRKDLDSLLDDLDRLSRG